MELQRRGKSRISAVHERLGNPVQGEAQAKAPWDNMLLDHLVGDLRTIRWETMDSLNEPMRYVDGAALAVKGR